MCTDLQFHADITVTPPVFEVTATSEPVSYDNVKNQLIFKSDFNGYADTFTI